MTRQWWGQQFFDALESFTDIARLKRGRSYYKAGHVLATTIEDGEVCARVLGKANTYFGVHTPPTYDISIKFRTLPEKTWNTVVDTIAGELRLLSECMMGKIPSDIEAIFASTESSFLPISQADFKRTSCSCPDFYNPCKHIAAVYYEIAEFLDSNPFLMFQLRGLNPQTLRKRLIDTPLGRAFASLDQQTELPPLSSCYTKVKRKVPKEPLTSHQFWKGGPLPPSPPPEEHSATTALLRRGDDYPQFWPKETSFLDFMQDLYCQVNKELVDASGCVA